MTASIDIYSRVTDYIEHKITLREMESWVVSMLPIYLSNPDSDAAILASRVELGLAEIQAGIRTERGLRRLLAQRIRNRIISPTSHPYKTSDNITISSSSSKDTTDFEWADLTPSWSSVPQVVNV